MTPANWCQLWSVCFSALLQEDSCMLMLTSQLADIPCLHYHKSYKCSVEFSLMHFNPSFFPPSTSLSHPIPPFLVTTNWSSSELLFPSALACSLLQPQHFQPFFFLQLLISCCYHYITLQNTCFSNFLMPSEGPHQIHIGMNCFVLRNLFS